MSVSFSIARELLEAAEDAQVQSAELIGIVLSVTVLLGALPGAVAMARTQLMTAWFNMSYSSFHFQRRATGAVGGGRQTVHSKPSQDDDGGRGVTAFALLFVRIAQRISAAICVQLVAANVSATQPLRSVRVITLLAVAVFFVFVESTATIGRTTGSPS